MRIVIVSAGVLLLACGRVAPATDDGAGPTDSESGPPELDVLPEPEPDLPPALDLPPEPECPAGLGEVVTCECALVEGCSIPNSEPDTGCAFACDAASPCPEVTCTFNGSIDPTGCEADLDVAALECVFDALAEGQPIRWKTRQRDSYINQWNNSSHDWLRLGATTYVRSRTHAVGNHVDLGDTTYSIEAFELPESAWMECEALADDHDRFECLHELGSQAEPCADPADLICP